MVSQVLSFKDMLSSGDVVRLYAQYCWLERELINKSLNWYAFLF